MFASLLNYLPGHIEKLRGLLVAHRSRELFNYVLSKIPPLPSYGNFLIGFVSSCDI